MIFYATEIEFQQAAINYTARLISERASSVISTGNVADIGEECLGYLKFIALDNGLSIVIVGTYLDLIEQENAVVRMHFDE